MWFLKQANIPGFNKSTAPNGTDWRTNGYTYGGTPSQTLPSAADAGNYFYLPALGFYPKGKLRFVGGNGYYWSSSALPWYSNNAFFLNFSSSYVNVIGAHRDDGNRVGVGAFE